MKREFLQNIRVGEQSLPKEVIDAIMEENGRDIQSGKVWKEKYEQAVADHAAKLEQMQFQTLLDQSIAKAGGRNARAISALLDLKALQADPAGLEAALAAVKAECHYLFDSPPPYASGTGAQQTAAAVPVTLAGALRERFAGK